MKRNPIAKALRNAAFKVRIVRSKKGKGSYKRKKQVSSSD